MKVFGKLRPGAVVELRWPHEDHKCDVKILDCKNGQVTLGVEGEANVELARRGESGSDPTPE